MNDSTNKQTSRENEYFDLYISGLGYLNRFRSIPVNKGQGYFAVDIAALEGSKDDPTITRFDANVAGKEAVNVLDQVKEAIADADAKVFAGFRLGGLYPSTFVYQNGERKGEQGISLKTRLLRINWVKIKAPGSSTYETVYTAPRPDASEESEADSQVAA